MVRVASHSLTGFPIRQVHWFLSPNLQLFWGPALDKVLERQLTSNSQALDDLYGPGKGSPMAAGPPQHLPDSEAAPSLARGPTVPTWAMAEVQSLLSPSILADSKGQLPCSPRLSQRICGQISLEQPCLLRATSTRKAASRSSLS